MSLHYRSTRSTDSYTFDKAVLQGLAPDGGLFVPEFWPKHIDLGDPKSIQNVGYEVTYPFVSGIPSSEYRALITDALNFEVPLHRLENAPYEGIRVLELFHGPTLSFKDFGARTLARVMAKLSDKPIHILTATSGDTGSAVADGFAGFDNVKVTLLYPKGKISSIQELQLTVKRKNVTAIAVEGSFDDCQKLVKSVFSAKEFAGKFSSANSINIGRLLPQMSYYAYTLSTVSDDAVIVVPSGNLGNLCAGLMAASVLSKPNIKFVAAHNNNDSFAKFLHGKSFEASDTKETISNAMDVGNPSNFERLMHIFGEDALRSKIEGYSVSEDETRKTMTEVFETNGYLACPHTAVGLTAARKLRSTFKNRDIISLATAHPAKFPDVVSETTGIAPSHDSLERLKSFEHHSYSIQPNLNELIKILVP